MMLMRMGYLLMTELGIFPFGILSRLMIGMRCSPLNMMFGLCSLCPVLLLICCSLIVLIAKMFRFDGIWDGLLQGPTHILLLSKLLHTYFDSHN